MVKSGSRAPLTRGRPGSPVGAGAGACNAASQRSRVVTVTRPGNPRQARVAYAASPTRWTARSENRSVSRSSSSRASTEGVWSVAPGRHKRARTGRHSGRCATNGTRTSTPSTTQRWPHAGRCRPGPEPSWCHAAPWSLRPVRRSRVSSTATSSGALAGSGIVGIGGRPGRGGNRPPNLTGGVPGEQVGPALPPHVTATPLTHSATRPARAWPAGTGRWDDPGMDSEELTSRVRALRARGSTPKAIARALGVPPATVAPLVRAIAAEDHASAPERELIQCWVSPGWRQGLTVDGHRDWPDVDTPDTGASGLVSVLVTRQARYGKVRVCGWLVDVYCLGVKDTIGPRSMDQRRVAELTGSYFAAYQARPLAAPLDLAQHLVFGAVAYARRLGFEPAPGFDQTTGHLGSWTGPSAISFGHNGKPLFVQGPHDNAASILNTLERSVGPNNFHYLVTP